MGFWLTGLRVFVRTKRSPNTIGSKGTYVVCVIRLDSVY